MPSTSVASAAASVSGCRDSTSADAAHARDLRGIRGRIRVRLHLPRWTRRSSSKATP